MRKRLVLIGIGLILFGVLQGCGPATPSPESLTQTAAAVEVQDTRQALSATQTAVAEMPTNTPIPDTPTPTETEVPSATPTKTEVPPTDTPEPTDTSVPPTKAPASSDTGSSGSSGGQTTSGTINCNQQSAGTSKIRVENLTDGPMSLYFYGAENYACSVSTGVARIYLKSGSYSISAFLCGTSVNYGSHAINPNWYFHFKCP